MTCRALGYMQLAGGTVSIGGQNPRRDKLAHGGISDKKSDARIRHCDSQGGVFGRNGFLDSACIPIVQKERICRSTINGIASVFDRCICVGVKATVNVVGTHTGKETEIIVGAIRGAFSVIVHLFGPRFPRHAEITGGVVFQRGNPVVLRFLAFGVCGVCHILVQVGFIRFVRFQTGNVSRVLFQLRFLRRHTLADSLARVVGLPVTNVGACLIGCSLRGVDFCILRGLSCRVGRGIDFVVCDIPNLFNVCRDSIATTVQGSIGVGACVLFLLYFLCNGSIRKNRIPVRCIAFKVGQAGSVLCDFCRIVRNVFRVGADVGVLNDLFCLDGVDIGRVGGDTVLSAVSASARACASAASAAL